MIKQLLLTLLPTITCFSAVTNIKTDNTADKVIYGNVITMDESNPTAEAIAIKDGKIIALGNKDDVSNYISEETVIEKYSNSDYIYPGFIDAHSHYALLSSIIAGGLTISREKPGVYEMGDFVAYAKEMKKYIDENPDKEEYKGFGMWVMDESPKASTLDEYCPTNKPVVFIGAGGHDVWLNTPAIKKYIGNFEGTEIEKDQVDAWISEVGEDCVIFEQRNGHKIPTGYFYETARFRIVDNLSHSLDEIKEVIKNVQDASLYKGFTAVGDCSIVENDKNPQVTAIKQLRDAGELKIKLRSFYEIREYDSKQVRDLEFQKAVDLAEETKNDEYFQVVGIKVFLDGVFEALSAYTLNEYPSFSGKREGYKGIQRWYTDSSRGIDLNQELKELVYKANKAGLAVEFHAMGDAAIRQALDACQYSNETFIQDGKTPFENNAISHLGYINHNDISRFNQLGVTAVVAPLWAPACKSILLSEQKCLGVDKAEDMFIIKSIMDTGGNVAFHTDGNASSVPELIYNATTRKSTNLSDFDHVRGENEKISGFESLKCITTNAVKTLNTNNIKGMIKVGFAADFSIFNKNFIDNKVVTNLNECNSAKLVALYNNGEIIYKATNVIIPTLSIGAIVGICIGSVIGFTVILYFVMYGIWCKKRKGPKFLIKSFEFIHYKK